MEDIFARLKIYALLAFSIILATSVCVGIVIFKLWVCVAIIKWLMG